MNKRQYKGAASCEASDIICIHYHDFAARQRKFLGFGNLYWRHVSSDFVQVLGSACIALRRRYIPPRMGLNVILRHAFSVAVHDTEVVLCGSNPLLSGLSIFVP